MIRGPVTSRPSSSCACPRHGVVSSIVSGAFAPPGISVSWVVAYLAGSRANRPVGAPTGQVSTGACR